MVKTEPLAHSIWSRARWLVLAPHPDDETLGAGALIGQSAAENRLAGIVYLTDGTGSHPDGTVGLASARRAEARIAIRRLASRSIRIDWLQWPDAHPHDPDSAPFIREAMRLGALLRHLKIDAVAVTAVTDSHCDHVAANQLAAAAVRLARRPVALFAYNVWSTPSCHRARRISTRSLPPGQRRHALHAHRSQLSRVYGEGFRLPAERQRMTLFDTLTLQGRR